MATDPISVRHASLEDRQVWDREPEPDVYHDEIWEVAYSDLEAAMKASTRRFRREVGLLMVNTWRTEEQTVRLIAERGGAVVGCLSFRREPEFHRAAQARIIEIRLETQEMPKVVLQWLLKEARLAAASRGIRWLTYRTRALPSDKASFEECGFIEYSRLPGGIETFDEAVAGAEGEYWNGRRYTDEVSYYLPTIA